MLIFKLFTYLGYFTIYDIVVKAISREFFSGPKCLILVSRTADVNNPFPSQAAYIGIKQRRGTYIHKYVVIIPVTHATLYYSCIYRH